MAMIPLNLRLSRELWTVIQYLSEQEQISAAQWVRERLWAMAANEAGLRGESLEALLIKARASDDDDGEEEDDEPSDSGKRGGPPSFRALGTGLLALAVAPGMISCGGAASRDDLRGTRATPTYLSAPYEAEHRPRWPWFGLKGHGGKAVVGGRIVG